MKHQSVHLWSQQLRGKISPELLIAPKTSADSINQYPSVNQRIIRFLESNVIGKPWADHLALIALVSVAKSKDVSTIINNLTSLNCRLQTLFTELKLSQIEDWNAQQYIPLYLKGELAKQDNQSTRKIFWSNYITSLRQTHQWLNKLSKTEQQIYRQFVFPMVKPEIAEGLLNSQEILERQQKKRKQATEAILPQFPAIRSEAHLRYNKMHRLYKKWLEVLELALSGNYTLPLSWSYEENQEKLYFRVWDRCSFIKANQENYSQKTVEKALEKFGSFSDDSNNYFLEFVRAQGRENKSCPEGLWFEEMMKLGMLSQHWAKCPDPVLREKREQWLMSWGYADEDGRAAPSCYPFRTNVSGILHSSLADGHFIASAQPFAQGLLFMVEPLYVAVTFGLLAIDILTTTGMRINELMQISLDEDCFKIFEIPPCGQNTQPRYRYAFQLIPKGERTNKKHDFFVGEQTKQVLVKVSRLLEKHYNIAIENDESLPQVPFSPSHPRSHRFDKAPYLFQYNHRHLDNRTIIACMRFLVHGMIFKTVEGKAIVITPHLLRHGFATHAVHVEKMPIDIVASLLKQKNIKITEYYSQRTESMVAELTDFYLAKAASYINVQESVIRTPEELEAQRLEALKRIGTLHHVLGGDCTFNGLCLNGLACSGCVHKVPNPAKRYQVQQQLEWGFAMLAFFEHQGLLLEAERSKQLIRACETELMEMDLIEAYLSDEEYDPTIQIEES